MNTRFEPAQSPGEAVSVVPTTGDDGEIVGSERFFGGAALTTAVGKEVPGAEPSGVIAVTVTRIVLPTSDADNRYVPPVAPGMFVQPEPEPPQRFHWYAYEVGALTQIQLPLPAERSVPSTNGPGGVIAGATVFATAGPQAGSEAPGEFRTTRSVPLLGATAARPAAVAYTTSSPEGDQLGDDLAVPPLGNC